MEAQQIFDGDGCCACAPESAELSGYVSCADKRNVFTGREEKILEKIRDASMRARAIKEELRASGLDEMVREDALRELGRLRQLRAELELERVAAAEERMKLLGHL